MNTNNQPVVVAKGPSTLARARFGPGMLLQHDDLEQLNVYTRELNRLMFRSLFGCGVVCGLVVTTAIGCGKVTVTVGAGLALDCQGDPIHVPKPQRLVLDEDCDPDIKPPLWVVLCRTEKCCAPRTAMCASDDDETASVSTRERDWFEIRIVRTRPRCTCGCAEPDTKDTVQGHCDPKSEGKGEERADMERLPVDACLCADPRQACYRGHYAGLCGCSCDDCADCADCDCDCVLLARLDRDDKAGDVVWTPDHRVRRFIRPVLMRDPQVALEEKRREPPEPKGGQPDTPQTVPAVLNQDAAATAAASAEVRRGRVPKTRS